MEAMRMYVVREKVLKVTELRTLQDEYNILDNEIDTARREAKIHITGIAHNELKICIGRASYLAKESLKDIVYRNINDEIVLIPGSDA